MLPIINHPDYVAQIGDDHRFPIQKFGELIKLLKKKISQQVVILLNQAKFQHQLY